MCATPASQVSRTPRPVTSCPAILMRARANRAQARDRLDQLVLPVAVDPGQRHDLAAAHGERHVPHRLELAVVEHVEVLDLQHRLAGLCRGLLHLEEHLASDHQTREALLGRALGGHGVDLLAAPQHGHPVGDLEHLTELVADEHDGCAVGLERVEHLEELVRLLGREHGRGLVQHEDLGVAIERLQDLDALLGADGHILDQGVGVHREPVAIGQLTDLLGPLPDVEQPAAPAGLVAEHDVLGHGHHRHEHEVLVDHADAEVDRLGGRVDLDRLAVDEHLALVGVVEPVEDRHQGRLAGAVLPQQGVHLAALQVEVDPVVGYDRAEPLRYSS